MAIDCLPLHMLDTVPVVHEKVKPNSGLIKKLEDLR
jgi:hypothetical protein